MRTLLLSTSLTPRNRGLTRLRLIYPHRNFLISIFQSFREGIIILIDDSQFLDYDSWKLIQQLSQDKTSEGELSSYQLTQSPHESQTHSPTAHSSAQYHLF